MGRLQVIDIKGNSTLVGMWYFSLLASKRADMVFYEAPHDLESVLLWTQRCSHIYGVFNEKMEIIGAGWSICANPPRTEIGFGFNSLATGKNAVEGARLMIDRIFSEVFYPPWIPATAATGRPVNYLFGLTPEINKPALKLASRVGLNLSEPIPDLCTTWSLDGENRRSAGVYTYISREEWTKLRQTK